MPSDAPEEAQPPARPGATRVTTTIQAGLFQGPLPAPADFQGYEIILPGAAERIMREAERASAHLREMEAKTLRANLIIDLAARFIAFAFATAALGVAAFLAVQGQPWVAGAIVTGTLGAVVVALVGNRRE